MDSDTIISIGLWLAYLLFLVAVAAAVILPVIHIIKSPKSLVRSGMGVGLMLVVFAVSYGLSGSELTPKYEALGIKSAFSSQMIGAGLTMFYLVFIISILGMVYSEISKAFK